LLQRIRDLRTPLRTPDYRAIWLAQVLSELGDWAARVALAFLVLKRTGSPALTAMVTTVSVLPWVGFGQILATLGDRFPRKRVLVAADLFRAIAFASLAAPVPIPVVFAVAFVAALATPPFESAKSAIVPEIVPEECYGDALALSHMTNQTAQIVGFISGGGLIALISPQYALLVNSASFLLSALSLARLKGGRVAQPAQSTRSRLGAAATALMSDHYLRRAALLGVLPQCSAMAAESLVAVYVRDELHRGPAMIGILAAVVPVGMIVAATFTPRRGEHLMLLRVSALLVLIGSTIAFVGFLAHLALPWAVIPYFGVGIVFALVVPANTVVGARLPRDVRASAFGLLQGSLMAAQALGAAIGGLLASAIGVAGACAIAMLPTMGYAAFAFTRLPRSDGIGDLDPAATPDRTLGAEPTMTGPAPEAMVTEIDPVH
jgi:MFS family permease